MPHRKLALTLLLFAAGVLGFRSAPTLSPSDEIKGAWRVEDTTLKTPDGERYTFKHPGVFIFTNTHYSWMWVTKDGPRNPISDKPTEAELLAAFTPFGANAGTYIVKGDQLTITPVVAKVPNRVGTSAMATLRFADGLLYITEEQPNVTFIFKLRKSE